MSRFSEIRDRAQRPRRTVPIVLAGDLAQQIDKLEREAEQIQDAKVTTRRTLGSRSNPRLAEIEAELEALRVQAESKTVHVLVEGLAKTPWRALLAAHPPRDDHPEDRVFGVNEVTFAEPAIRACTLGHLVDGQLVAWEDGELDWMLGFITDRQTEKLVGAVITTSRGDDAIPLSRRLSTTPTSDDE